MQEMFLFESRDLKTPMPQATVVRQEEFPLTGCFCSIQAFN